MLRSGKKLSTFEFERQNIDGCCKQQQHINCMDLAIKRGEFESCFNKIQVSKETSLKISLFQLHT